MNDPILAFQALGDPIRWRIIHLVFHEALCVCEIAEILDMPQSSVSSHLQVIRRAGLLESERCEKWIYYRVARRFRPLLETVGRYFDANPAMDALVAKDAKKAVKRLARRAETCCPGPKELATPSPKKSFLRMEARAS
jgi:ArsR family transcriptional regulator, arsenate/arsenite/antimonite-responsive transcriptional repressor